jgi:signal transduction histidine kinase
MTDRRKAHTGLGGLKVHILVLMGLWTILVGGVLAWTLFRHAVEMFESARLEARSAFEKDLVYRRWATGHGGVYVPATDETPPNEHLSHVPERDITTPSGRRLTLVNPAYMTRQVHAMESGNYGLKGKITSLNPVNPNNAADEWETDALEALKTGLPEISSLEMMDGQEYLRFIGPLVTEEGCLDCHAEQGYKVGDIRGGISVSVPMAPRRAVSRKHVFSMVGGHSLIWLLGMVGIAGAGRRIAMQIRERDRAQEALEKQHQRLEELVQERTGQLRRTNIKLTSEIDDRKRLEQELLDISEREQRRIGRELHDSLGQQLTGAAIMSKVLQRKLDVGSAEHGAEAAQITRLINEAIDQTRSLSRGLQPVDVESGGLVPALEMLAASTRDIFGIDCTFTPDADIQIEDSAIGINLYRITQEAITNAIKHGQSKQIDISLWADEGAYRLAIASDGKDFPSSVGDTEGMGLRIMAYRAQAMGGSVDISKGADGGTIVSCRCPVEQPSKKRDSGAKS